MGLKLTSAKTIIPGLLALTGAGALVAFGWIFGEHAATRLVDRLESRKETEEKEVREDDADTQVRSVE